MRFESFEQRSPVILCVDDKEDNLLAYRSVFRRSFPGLRVLLTQEIDEAVALASESPVDLALVDLNINRPNDGFELLRRLKENERTSAISVIMITALITDGELRAEALELGADDFVSKPVDSAELAARVRALLRIKRTEAALATSRANLLNVVEHNADGMVVVGQDRRILFVNSAAEAIFDVPPGRLVGEPFRLPVPKDELVEAEIRRRSGAQALVEMRAVETLWEGQRAWVVSLRDITERRHLEVMFNQAQKMEAVGRLAGGVVHDFKNLLQGIQGLTELLRERLEPDSDESGIVDQIEQITLRASELTGQLLTFSRRQPLTIREFELNELIDRSIRMLRCVLGQTIFLDFRPSAEPCLVRGDMSQLELVLFNLCLNGRDAMPHGGSLTIETGIEEIAESDPRRRTWARTERYVSLRIADTGKGMNQETQARIFEPFFTTKPPDQGTGLGLSTVYGIVDQHEGSIEVESAPNQGSVFTVFLPSVGPGDEGRRPTVLLAEGDAITRLATRRLLERSGYEVIPVEDEDEALRVLDARPPRVNVAVVSEALFEHKGGELTALLRRRRPDLSVILTRSTVERTPEPEDLPEGCEILSRPVRNKLLLEKLRETAKGREGGP